MPSTIIPCLRYRDAHAAIAWLQQVFGFTAHAVFDGPDNTVAHAELTLGDGMVMISSVGDRGALGAVLRQPDELGLMETQSPCITVTDAAAIHRNAVSAAASIVAPLAEMPYGGKAFSCRDPEGHLWFVGEYDPWAPQA